MNLTTSVLFYLLFGNAVAVAVHQVFDAANTLTVGSARPRPLFSGRWMFPLLYCPIERSGKAFAAEAATEHRAP